MTTIRETTAFVGGDWVPTSGEDVTLVDPSREAPFATVRLAGGAEIDVACAAARDAFDAWAATSIEERVAVLLALAAHLEQHGRAYADLLLQEIGLPVPFAVGNLLGASGQLTYYAGLADRYPWTEHRTGRTGVNVEIDRVPSGVVGAIVPWNAPISLAASKIAPALLAGCTTIIKASPLNALSIRCFGDAAAAVGVPAGVINVVVADGATSERLVANPAVDKIAFTGSDATGRRIAEVAARTLKRVTLELGGKSAGIVLEDAPLDRVRQTVPQAFTLNNGEACAAMTRLIVPRRREDEIVDAIAAVVTRIAVGDPRDPATVVGPLATAEHHARVMDHIDGARRRGEIVCGGGRPDDLDVGFYLAPTIVRGVTPDDPVAQQELFAPVLTVLPYDDLDEAVEIANATPYGLSGAVFGADDAQVLDVARRVRSGSVHLNNGFTVDIDIPFGGFKASGYGREFGPEAIDAYVETRAVFLDGQPYGSENRRPSNPEDD